jgi:L,D-transpeptidase catalytic domain
MRASGGNCCANKRSNPRNCAAPFGARLAQPRPPLLPPQSGLDYPLGRRSRGMREPSGGTMKRLRFLVFLLPALAFLCGATGQALAAVLIVIDKPSQTMTVAVNGNVQYRWYVSTGATGYSTPGGSYTPFRLERMHYSREWDNAGMPHSIFFTSRGHAIHGSDHPGRGSPRSHGCVRLAAKRGDPLPACRSARHGEHQGRGQRI